MRKFKIGDIVVVTFTTSGHSCICDVIDYGTSNVYIMYLLQKRINGVRFYNIEDNMQYLYKRISII